MYLKLYDVSTYYVVLGYVLLAVSLASVNPGRCHRHTVHWTVISKKRNERVPRETGLHFRPPADEPSRSCSTHEGFPIATGWRTAPGSRRPDSMSARLVVSCRTIHGLT